MMKLLFQKLFEPQNDWFAKKGVSLHGSMFLFKKEENGELFTEFHDLYSEADDKQNWYFSASCLEESIKNFKNLHPEMSTITLWTDNGAHYKNTSLVLWLSNISALTGVQVSSFRNFEPQKGKTKLDGHYATLKFSLKRFRREGNDVMSGEQIEKGTNGRLRGTRVGRRNAYQDCGRSQTIYDRGIVYFVMDNMPDQAFKQLQINNVNKKYI